MRNEETGAHGLSIRDTVAGAAFTALIAVGAYISVPIGPVPIVLQNFFVILAGLLLGPKRGAVCVGVYLLIGTVGLPVFAGGTGGPAHFFGPTGGYLLGFLPAVILAGFLSRQKKTSPDRVHSGSRDPERERSVVRFLTASAVGAGAIYLTGVPWLMYSTNMSLGASLAVGLYPFVPGDAIKVIAAAFTARGSASRFEEFLQHPG